VSVDVAAVRAPSLDAIVDIDPSSGRRHDRYLQPADMGARHVLLNDAAAAESRVLTT
jgi:hypothetical protein